MMKLVTCLLCEHCQHDEQLASMNNFVCQKYGFQTGYSDEDYERGIVLSLLASQCPDYYDRRKHQLPESLWKFMNFYDRDDDISNFTVPS